MVKQSITALLLILPAVITANIGDLTVAADNPEPVANSYFGHALASEEDRFWVVRASLSVSNGGDLKSWIYQYVQPDGMGTLLFKEWNMTGVSERIALCANEGRIAMSHRTGSPNWTQVASIYTRDIFGKLSTAAPPLSSQEFGSSVMAFSGKLLVGSPNDNVGGQVHVFNSATGGYEKTLFNPRLSAGLDFGYTMAVATPNRLAIHDRNRGVFIYDENLSSTLELFQGDGFNFHSMAAGSGYVAWSTITNSKITIFDVRTNQLVREILRPENLYISDFGKTLAIDGDLIAVGAPVEHVNTVSDVGMVRIYRISSGELVSTVYNPVLSVNPSLAEFSNFGAVLQPYKGSFLVGMPDWSSSFSTRNVGRVYRIEGEPRSAVSDWTLY